MSSGKKKSEEGIQQAGQQAYARSQATPEESAQYSSSFELGKLLEQTGKSRLGLAPAPSGYLTPEQQYLSQAGDLGKSYYQQTLAGVQDPYGAYESQLQPSLKAMSDYINSQFQQRGLLRSGLNIEGMGRAGVELAIREAQDRMNFRSQELARGGELTNYMDTQQQTQLANLSNIYGTQQAMGQQAMGRQAGAAQNAAQYQAYPYQAQLGANYGTQAALQALPGQLIGAAGTAMTGGFNPWAQRQPISYSVTMPYVYEVKR